MKNNRENKKNDHSFPYLPILLLQKMFFCRLNQTGPINVNMRFQTVCIILSFLPCFATHSSDPQVNKDFFLFEFFSKNSLSCSKGGAMHV